MLSGAAAAGITAVLAAIVVQTWGPGLLSALKSMSLAAFIQAAAIGMTTDGTSAVIDIVGVGATIDSAVTA